MRKRCLQNNNFALQPLKIAEAKLRIVPFSTATLQIAQIHGTPRSVRPQSKSIESRAKSTQKRTSSNLRRALDDIAQDLLSLSDSLSKTKAERDAVHVAGNCLRQTLFRAIDVDIKLRIRKEAEALDRNVQMLDQKLLNARRNEIPTMAFYVRLKRLHGRLPHPKAARSRNMTEAILHDINLSMIKKLLSLPTPDLLYSLALHLLSTPLPFSEECFNVMLYRLSLLRYTSAARSVYRNFLSSGLSLNMSKPVALVLALNSSIGDWEDFSHLQILIDSSDLKSDVLANCALITGNLKSGRTEDAWQRFANMLANGMTPGLPVLTRLLHDAASRRSWRRGLQIWKIIEFGSHRGIYEIDPWAFYEMRRLCRRCGLGSVARFIHDDTLRSRLNLGIFGHRKRLPVRPSNKSPELIDIHNAIRAGLRRNGARGQLRSVGYISNDRKAPPRGISVDNSRNKPLQSSVSSGLTSSSVFTHALAARADNQYNKNEVEQILMNMNSPPEPFQTSPSASKASYLYDEDELTSALCQEALDLSMQERHRRQQNLLHKLRRATTSFSALRRATPRLGVTLLKLPEETSRRLGE